jgi:hypothetical protein
MPCRQLFFAEFGGRSGLAFGDDHVLERRFEMGPTLNAGLDQHIDWAAHHHQVLDFVPAYQQQLPFGVDRSGLDHAEALVARRMKPLLDWPPKNALNAQTRSAPSAITNKVAAMTSTRKSRSTMANVLTQTALTAH